MSKQDDFNAILDYFYLGGQGTLAEKIKNAVSHELTCGDLSHHYHVANDIKLRRTKYRAQEKYCKLCDSYMKMATWPRHQTRLGHQRNVRSEQFKKYGRLIGKVNE